MTASVLLMSQACHKLGLGGGDSPTAPSGPPAAGSTIVYSAVGASDANGVGSSAPCLPYTECAGGMGYVPVAIRQLKGLGYTVNPLNLGLPTAVIGPDFQALGQRYGRTIEANFIDQEMPFVLPQSTVITIFAGANDVNTITAALGSGAGGTDPNGYIDSQVRAFGADVTTLLNGIRTRAPGARVIMLNVPNLGALPYLARVSPVQRQAAQRAAVGMTTTVVNPLAAPNTVVIDLMCDSRSYETSNYSGDGLHPNDAGHAFIAAEVVRAMTSASYPAPRNSCAPMTLVP